MKPILLAALLIIAAWSNEMSQERRPLPPSGPISVPRGGFPPPARSPIVFISNRDGNTEIYRTNPDGSGTRRLTFKVDAEDTDPHISPDGNRIAFATNRDGNFEIYAMNVDGSSPARLTNNPAEDTAPSWSPDGRRIIFGRVTFDGRVYEHQLLIMNADGTGERLISRSGRSPAWSPDGRKIAFDGFLTFPGISTTQIYAMNVDGTGVSRLTGSPSTEGSPDWSPDGTRILFGRGGEVWVMNADGSGQRGMGSGRHPAWSRDGRQIVFVRGPDDATQLYTMNADGSSPTRISDSAGHNYRPDW